MTGIQLIEEERQRQIEEIGYDQEHDDSHGRGELAEAALAFLHSSRGRFDAAAESWPFAGKFTPSHHAPHPAGKGGCVRDLTKAGALIAAEIDRLNRSS